MSGKSFGRKSGEIYQVNNLGSSTKTPWLCEEEVSYGCESSKKIQSCKGSDSDTVDSFCRCHALFHRGRFSWETDEQRISIFFAHVHIFGLHVPPSDSLSDHLLYRNDICSFGEERACSCSHWNIYSGADRNYFFAVLHRSGSYCNLLYRTGRLGSMIDGLTFDEKIADRSFFINKGKSLTNYC